MAFAASQSFPLQELARNQAATFRHQRSVLSLGRPLARFFVPVAGAFAARFMLHYAHRFAQQAVWFRGAGDSVSNEPMDTEIDAQDSLRTTLDQMEIDLTEIAESALGIASGLRRLDGNQRGNFRDALDRLALACQELKDEVRAFKGAVQAHDANVGVLQKARKVARTPADLHSDLERATL